MMGQILTIRLYAAGIGIVVRAFLGSFDDLLYALVMFVATDYVMGVLRAITSRMSESPSSRTQHEWASRSAEIAGHDAQH